jgi:hypothetical protein
VTLALLIVYFYQEHTVRLSHVRVCWGVAFPGGLFLCLAGERCGRIEQTDSINIL